tara:strand:+ start:268 stop:861 length:594 start_codon:yes stop_codon:yes gene_type:complete
MILIFITTACTLIVEKLRESSQNTEEPEQTTEEVEPSVEIIDTATAEPAMEPSQPISEPEAVEPSEPAIEPSQPTSEPEDTAEMDPCGNDQICEITISNPTLFGCDSVEPQEIVFSNAGVGSLFIYHKSVYSGCCPTFVPTATADLNTSTIQVEYSFTDDLCDCVCEGISVRYTLDDIPTGTYQLSALTETVQVTVE